MKFYTLDGKIPVVTTDVIEWGMWFSNNDKIVKQTTIHDGTRVSTVFLGLDQSWNSDVPILFETMIFGGEHDEYQDHYATWEEAEIGHEKAIEMIFHVTPN